MLLLVLMFTAMMGLWLGILVTGDLEGLEVAGREFDSTEKPQQLWYFRVLLRDQPRPLVWKRLMVCVSDDDAGRRQLHHHCHEGSAVHDTKGVG